MSKLTPCNGSQQTQNIDPVLQKCVHLAKHRFDLFRLLHGENIIGHQWTSYLVAVIFEVTDDPNDAIKLNTSGCGDKAVMARRAGNKPQSYMYLPDQINVLCQCIVDQCTKWNETLPTNIKMAIIHDMAHDDRQQP